MNQLVKPTQHIPVLVPEILEGLKVAKDTWFVDATVGGGGHSSEFLKVGANVLAFDQDPEAIARLQIRFSKEIEEKRLILVKDNFAHLHLHIRKLGKPITGILFDLGMSTDQLRISGRGFSFLKDEPLDMRMSQSGETAGDFVNTASFRQLVETFITNGEEPLAEAIASQIIATRKKSPLLTASALAALVKEVYAERHVGQLQHPATRIFQALRIAVNDELLVLKNVIPDAFKILDTQGRLGIISFHSLEDRIVKQAFINFTNKNQGKLINKKPIRPTEKEMKQNPASRSAKLRIIEKI